MKRRLWWLPIALTVLSALCAGVCAWGLLCLGDAEETRPAAEAAAVATAEPAPVPAEAPAPAQAPDWLPGPGEIYVSPPGVTMPETTAPVWRPVGGFVALVSIDGKLYSVVAGPYQFIVLPPGQTWPKPQGGE